MPGPRSSNTYTCTCTHFCGGYKPGLSRATYYRHSPYRDHDAAQPQATSSFSASFQNFLDKSAGNSNGSGSGILGIGQDESQGNTDGFEVAQNFEEGAGVNFPY